MTTETILTDKHIKTLALSMSDHELMQVVPFARAIEQAVLQSEQVQAWKRDAERMDVMAQKRMLVSPEYEGGWHVEIYDESEAPIAVGFSGCLRTAIDSAMEQQE